MANATMIADEPPASPFPTKPVQRIARYVGLNGMRFRVCVPDGMQVKPVLARQSGMDAYLIDVEGPDHCDDSAALATAHVMIAAGAAVSVPTELLAHVVAELDRTKRALNQYRAEDEAFRVYACKVAMEMRAEFGMRAKSVASSYEAAAEREGNVLDVKLYQIVAELIEAKS